MHDTQKAILELAKKGTLRGLPLREIGKKIGEKHPQKIKHHLGQLKKKGFIGDNDAPQSLKSLGNLELKNHDMVSIPILGSANCGEAKNLALESLEGFLKVSTGMVPKQSGLFAVKAMGLSMNKANINGKSIEDGDYVIINPKIRNPADMDYVLSVINGAANIKKFVRDKENRQVVLVSESTDPTPPIYIHFNDQPDYFVNGKVVAVIKKPKKNGD